MKLLVVGDLHGRKPKIKTKDFDAFVLVGDICDDRKIGPLYKKYFQLIKNPDEKIEFEDFVYREVGKKKMEKYEKESLVVGKKILQYLDSFGKPIFIVGGNWDQSYGKTRIKDLNKNFYNYLKYFYDSWLGDKLNSGLTSGIKNLKNCMFHSREFKEVNFIGYGLSSAPENLKRKTKYRGDKKISEEEFRKLKSSYEKLVDKLENVYKNRRNKNLPTFFITHNIPYGTKLDMSKDKKSYAYKKHLGSTLARNFCKKFKPIICVGGHVHEGKGKDKIGGTLVVNPGFMGQVLVEIDQKKIKSVKFL
jgi:Icc-related predicted phosphoesterase